MLFELPKELQTHIFQFDNTYHLTHKACLDYLALPGTLEKIEDVDVVFNRANGTIAYPVLLKETFPEANKTINILNKCDCCPRHKLNKPINLNNLNDQYEYNIPGQGWANNRCECKCRHVSRWLCRANGNWPGY